MRWNRENVCRSYGSFCCSCLFSFRLLFGFVVVVVLVLICLNLGSHGCCFVVVAAWFSFGCFSCLFVVLLFCCFCCLANNNQRKNNPPKKQQNQLFYSVFFSFGFGVVVVFWSVFVFCSLEFGVPWLLFCCGCLLLFLMVVVCWFVVLLLLGQPRPEKHDKK